jgi:hypothetical protein
MWVIPGWAFGAAFSVLGLFGGIGLMIRMLPPELRSPGRKKMSEHDRERLDEVERRLDETEDVQRRLSELEGRLDFAERLLSRQREADRLASPER